MATFTITTSVNMDSLTAKGGGDIYNINGGTLTVDQDSRYGVEQTTSTTLGNITVSATLRGNIVFDASLVRLIPYNTGSGNVPAAGTTISQGSASGKLLAVYSALNVAPTAAGSPMPASGYVKIRQWNSVAYAAGALTGIGATATGADVVGWIEISADDGSTITMPRLGNQSTKLAQGAWYQIGTTDGNRATSYQIPSNGLLQYHAGVYVETGSGTGIYEFYPVSGETATAAKLGTDAVRGKFCYIATDGTLRFGNDGTNNSGGYVPPSGRKIVIGNIFFVCNTTAARTANVEPNATLLTRYKFLTTGGGVVNMDKVSMNWYTRWTNPYSLTLTNCGILTSLEPSNVATNVSIDRCGVGQHSSTAVATASLNALGCLAGLTVTNSVFGHSPGISNGYSASLANCNNVVLTSTKFLFSGTRTNTTTGSLSMGNVTTATVTSCVLNSRVLLTNCSAITFTNNSFYDPPGGNTLSANSLAAFNFITSNNILIDGLDFGGLTGVAPYGVLFQLNQSNNYNIRVRNIGSLVSPLDCGGARVDGVSWTRVTTTATVTSPSHGLTTGDTINVIISSTTVPISLNTKTVTVVDANTFTFAATNSGATSGTLSYFLVISSQLFSIQNNTYGNNVKFQRVHVTHLRVQPFSGANDNVAFQLDNCTVDLENGGSTGTLPINRFNLRSTQTLVTRTAQTSVYGTIWEDYYISRAITTPTGKAWSRTTTVATVTSADHNLRTNDIVNVRVSSDESAVALGQRTVTVIDKDTFTITATNAGSASGTLDYRPMNGILNIQMNESDSATSSHYTKDAGTPVFTSAGTLVMGTINDQVTWETPDYILGHLNFSVAEIAMNGATSTDYLVQYSINTGSGYSSFKNLSRPIVATGGANGSTTISVGDTSNISVGDYVFGTNVAPRAKVTSITNSTDFVVDKANTGVVSGTLRFNQLPSEPDNTSTGFKMKIRVKTLTTNTSAISALFLYTYSTATERAYTYALDPTTQTLEFINLADGTVVALYNSSNTELQRTTVRVDGVFSYSYVYSGSSSTGNYALIWHEDYYVQKYTAITLAGEDQSFFVNQELDLAYIPGSADISTFDYSGKIHVLDPTVSSGGQVDMSLPQLYSNWKDDILLSNHFIYDLAYEVVGGQDTFGVQSITLFFFQQNGWKMRPKEINHTGSLTDGVIVAESGGPIVPTTGSYNAFIEYVKPEHVITQVGSSTLTATDLNNIADSVWDEVISGHQTSGTTGRSLKEAEDSAELASIK